MQPIDLIVVGGSAGSIDVLREMLGQLPAQFPRPVAIVVHLPADAPGMLHELLASPERPRMKQAEDKEPIAAGTVYFASPGYHLHIETDRHFALSLDEPVHFCRPSIDVLFESAAEAYGPRLMGIVLSGANADGAQGLAAIAAAGGVTVVQQPDAAEMRPMPDAALRGAPASLVLDSRGLSELLLAQGAVR
jgi:two-component system chemotaxis response regulator CheB